MQMSMVMHWEVNSRMNSGMYRMNCRMDGMDCRMNTQCWMTVILENRLKIWSEWWRVRFMVNVMVNIMVNIMMNFIMNRINRMFFVMIVQHMWLFTGISISTVKFGNVWLGFFMLGFMMVRLWSVVGFGTRMDNFIRLQRLWTVMNFVVWLRSLIVRFGT